MKIGQVDIDARLAWIVGTVGLLGGAALALGMVTPGERITKVEVKVAEHETRIQKLEDLKDSIDSIADAVGAIKPKKRTR